VRAGGSFTFSLKLKNSGFAAPYNPRAFELLLRRADGRLYIFALPADPRFWLPNSTQTIKGTLRLPTSLGPGTYDVLLNLPDPEAALHDRPEYAIRLSSGAVAEAGTGYNRLPKKVNVARRR
jgi:hypothetical protein